MSMLILALIGSLCMQMMNTIIYVYSFEVEHIPKEIKTFINGSTINRSTIIINSCMAIFVLDLLVLCFRVKVW